MESIVTFPIQTPTTKKKEEPIRWEEIYEARLSEEIPLRIRQ